MNKLQLIITIASSKPLLTKALKIAFVVGIILNIINQGDQLFNSNFQDLNYLKIALTFTVPFCVSMYTAITMKLKFHVGEKSIENVTLRCTGCDNCISLTKKQVIPFCEICKDKTHWKVTSLKDKKCQQHK